VTLAAEGFRELADRLEAALGSAPVSPGAPATAGLRSLFRAYLEFARSRPALYKLMISRLGYSLHSESCRINSARAYGCLVQAVEQARAGGWRAEQDASSLVLSLWAEVHGWAGLLIDELLPEEFGATPEAVTRASEALLD
jgi:AcrR family transcriptional regulator